MSQIIYIHLGKAGIEIGDAFWTQIIKEHKINSDGSFVDVEVDGNMGFLFNQSSDGRQVPNALFLDLEPQAADEIRKGNRSKLYPKTQIINSKEGSSSNYCKANYSCGRIIIDQAMEQIRKLAERCDRVMGFCYTGAQSGGAGTGLVDLVGSRISYEFKKKLHLGFTVLPGNDIVVAPYNSILHHHEMLDHQTMAYVFENSSLYQYAEKILDVEYPSFHEINQIIGRQMANLVSVDRFSGSPSLKLNELATNAVPYPRLQFITSSLSFALSGSSTTIYDQTFKTTRYDHNLSGQKILAPQEFLFSCCKIYQGDATHFEAVCAISQLKKQQLLPLLQHTPTGILTGIVDKRPTETVIFPKSQVEISSYMNSTTYARKLEQILQRYNQMYNKRGFIHWYIGEGIHDGIFEEARENVLQLIHDYQESKLPSLPSEDND